MTCRHANRSDCAQFGERPSKEWYAKMIQETEGLDDHLPCGGAAKPAEGLPYGIIDPDYARVFTMARILAWAEGYALAMHGSFTRDLDLVAIPWAERVCEPERLVRRIEAATGLKQTGHPPGNKPHGRLAWTLLFPKFGDPRFVDLSVIPPAALAPASPHKESQNG